MAGLSCFWGDWNGWRGWRENPLPRNFALGSSRLPPIAVNETMKNPWSTIYTIQMGKSTHIIGFAWELGLLLFAQGAAILHPLLLYLLAYCCGPIDLFSWASLGGLLVEVLLALSGCAYWITVSQRHFRLLETFLGIPYCGFKASLEGVSLSDPLHTTEVAEVHVYLAEDLWEEMGFKDWVELVHKGKTHNIAGNSNHAACYQAITQAVSERRRG